MSKGSKCVTKVRWKCVHLTLKCSFYGYKIVMWNIGKNQNYGIDFCIINWGIYNHKKFKTYMFNPNILPTRNSRQKGMMLIWGIIIIDTLLWRHHGCDGVSNHQFYDCLLNHPFRRRSKKTSKLSVTGLCGGIYRWPVNSPYKLPVTRKMFSFDDIIMISGIGTFFLNKAPQNYEEQPTGVKCRPPHLDALSY